MLSEPQKKTVFRMAEEAGRALLELWPGNQKQDLQIQTKADGSLVSLADMRANDILLNGLRKQFPGFGVLSEETGFQPGAGNSRMFWIIDPLDGTKWFLNGEKEFYVLISLCFAGEIVFGLMYEPPTGRMYWAQKGKGAFVGDTKLQVSSNANLKANSVYLRDGNFPKFKEFERTDLAHTGPGIIALASGEIDALVYAMAKLGPWDVAPAAILISEAGGKVSNEKGEPLTFSHEAPFPIFAASNGLIHQEILKRIDLQQ